MHGLVVYLFAGLCWFGINLTILAQKVDVADRIRKHFAKELERAPVKERGRLLEAVELRGNEPASLWLVVLVADTPTRKERRMP